MDKTEKWPKRYRAEFITPGIMSYEDVDQGKVLVLDSALDKMLDSFIGKPVVNFLHQDLTPEEAYKINDSDLESMADGVVFDVGKMENGWSYADFMAWDEETQNNIDKKGFSISCAYMPTKVGPTGKYHGIDYDEEVLDGYYTHMAIVDNPRYERSKVYELPNSYNNSFADSLARVILNSKKESEKMKIFKFLNKKKDNTDDKPKDDKPKDEVVNMGEDSYVEDMENGEKIPMSELVAAYKAKKENECKDTKMNMEDMVDVDGEKVSMKDLYDNYKSTKEVDNAEPPTDTTAEESVDESLQNSTQQKTKKPVKPVMKNKEFQKLENAVDSQDPRKNMKINTKSERLKRGHNRYSSDTVEVK